MSKFFENRNILVTGASRGFGKAIALELAKRKANLFLIARNPTKLKEVQNEILERYPNIECIIQNTDLTDKAKVKIAIQNMLKKMKTINGIINNAGFALPNYFEKTDLSDFEKVMQLNYFGSLYITYFATPHLKENSFITFTSSVAGYMGIFGYSSYSSTKFALLGLAETLQQEFLQKKIQVSIVFPPDMATPCFEKENCHKPYESKVLSESGKLLDPEIVARRFLNKLEKRKFFITVSFESWLFYRLHAMFPKLVQKIIFSLLSKAEKKKPLTTEQIKKITIDSKTKN